MRFKTNYIVILLSLFMIILMVIYPNIVSVGVARGLVICSNVIVPSLLPFMVCVFLILKSDFTIKNKFLNTYIFKIWGINSKMFVVFLFSLIGGYPIGAKLLNELYLQKYITKKEANIMLMYCVNAGPAFIISAVGCKILYSQKIGIILYISHILSSLIMSLICGFGLKKLKKHTVSASLCTVPSSQIFVSSVSDALNSIITICGFVVFFSAFNSYVDYIFNNVAILKYITQLTEVTSAISKNKNLFHISFLLGFSGVSIWCQIFALTADIKVKYLRFILGRLTHGILSLFFTKLLFFTFKIDISVFNNASFNNKLFYSNATLFVSILIMLIVLISFIYTKNNSGKFIKDVI